MQNNEIENHNHNEQSSNLPLTLNRRKLITLATGMVLLPTIVRNARFWDSIGINTKAHAANSKTVNGIIASCNPDSSGNVDCFQCIQELYLAFGRIPIVTFNSYLQATGFAEFGSAVAMGNQNDQCRVHEPEPGHECRDEGWANDPVQAWKRIFYSYMCCLIGADFDIGDEAQDQLYAWLVGYLEKHA